MITRRALLGHAATAALTASGAAFWPQGTKGQPASLPQALSSPDAIVTAARHLGMADHVPADQTLLSPFDQLDYDSYRGVRSRPGISAALQLGPDFRADLLPPGWLFRDPVNITLPEHDTTFAADLFDFDTALIALPKSLPEPKGMGFSGLRLLHQLNAPDIWDEVLVLQGASYFRALAKDTVYGLSARALALGTGGSGPEEFPVTRHISVFAADAQLQFGCVIDSPRCAAALIVTLTPGRVTRMHCRLHLFPRVPIDDVGIAPLTSMFQHNDLGPARIDDFRPAVHDSDALVIDNGADERLWRPLSNSEGVHLSSFMDTGPRGFGLLQGPTGFDRFRDAEAQYHRRPSAWVRPHGDWGDGAVMLLEIPTANEFADNIVAFWRPAQVLNPGEYRFEYDLDWLAPGADALPAPTQALPLQPINSAAGVDPNNTAQRLFVVDFGLTHYAQEDLATLADGLVLDLGDAAGVELHGAAVYPVWHGAGFIRASFLLQPQADATQAELRLRLRHAAGADASPVWLYRWSRRQDGGV